MKINWQAFAGRYGDLAVTVVREAKQPVYKTALAKLTYLADWEHLQKYGKTISGADYRRQERGPLPVELFRLTFLDGAELRTEHGPKGGVLYSPGPSPRFRPELTPDELGTIRAVLARFSAHTVAALVDAAYQTPPMVDVIREEEKAGGKLYGRPLRLDEAYAP